MLIFKINQTKAINLWWIFLKSLLEKVFLKNNKFLKY